MQKVCLKCGFENPSHEQSDSAECPKCKVIYSKFEAAMLPRAQAAGLTVEQYVARASEIAQQLRVTREAENQTRLADEARLAADRDRQVQEAVRTGNWRRFSASEMDYLLDGITLTTGPDVPNHQIQRVIEVVSAECAFGMNVLSDFFTGVSDVVGGRSGTVQNSLRDARKTVLRELKKEALTVGANAVIGVDLDYSEFTGKGKNMLFTVATGTAVVCKPLGPTAA